MRDFAIVVVALVVVTFVIAWLLPRLDRLDQKLQAASDPLRAGAEKSGLFPNYGEEADQ